MPADIDTSKCATKDRLTLLYTGISPKEPSADGKISTSTLRDRIDIHFKRNASGSTLRLTLGCLLADTLGIELRRYGSTDRIFFGPGEKELDQWMAENALVSWITHPEPWIIEKQLITHLDVPLNLRDNDQHPFYSTLKALRDAGRQHARCLPNADRQP